MLCDYGCGLPAIVIFKNGKKCCATSVNKCPWKRKMDSNKKKTIPYEGSMLQKAHNANRGKPSWSAGKTKNTDERLKIKADAIKQKYSTGQLIHIPYVHTPESKEKLRQSINKRYDLGWKPTAGRCKKINYASPIAGSITLDGTWELRCAKWFDSVNLTWCRSVVRFPYVDHMGRNRTYTPDFLSYIILGSLLK